MASLDELVKSRGTAKGKLTRLINKIAATTPTLNAVDVLMDRAKCAFADYCAAQDVIACHEDADASDEDAAYAEEEDRFDTLIGRLCDIRQKLLPSIVLKTDPDSKSTFSGSDSSVKLPRIDLPTFCGKYTDWMPFADLFKATVDSNDRLSGSQKLQYLKLCLQGEPSRLIESYVLTNANYAIALKTLCDRYENRKLIIRQHLSALTSAAAAKTENSFALRNLIETFERHLCSLHNLDADHWDTIIVHLLSERLDSETRKQWELQSDVESKYDDLKLFLETRASALEASKSLSSTPAAPQSKQQWPKKTDSHMTYSTADVKCSHCKGPHRIYACNKYNSLSVTARNDFARTSKLCFNCLQPDHVTASCPSKSTCRQCQRRHHTMLHRSQDSSPAQSQAAKPPAADAAKTVEVAHSHARNVCKPASEVLLATANVPVFNRSQQPVICRALLDSGSQSSFISEECLQRLGLLRRKNNVSVYGIGGTKSFNANGIVDLNLGGDSGISVSCIVSPRLTRKLPSSFFPTANWTTIHKLKLADTSFNVPAPIDIIIGADVYDHVVLGNKMQENSMFLRETVFGWVASGCLEDCKALASLRSFTVTSECFDLRSFWELEKVPVACSFTPDEQACEDHFVANTRRLSDGRFEVRLPFRNGCAPNLDFTLPLALRRFNLLERRFVQKPELKVQYQAFVKEFLDMGHLEIVPPDKVVQVPGSVCYLPHHAVFKESSTTTKIRVVFDGSASSKDGVSLNSSLLVGAKTQCDLFDIILRFRFHVVALSADIAKMYRQVALHPSDRGYHRILWRSESSQELQHLQMTRVTYGVASSAHHSTRCLQAIADSEPPDSIIAPVLRNDFYVDDLCGGANSIAEAKAIQTSLIEILARAGLPLRKWTSSHPEVISGLPEDMREVSSLDFSADHTIKTLGIVWNPTSDSFMFVVAPPEKVCSKRALLSDTSRIFDPLGWLAPLVINLKCLFQRCWALGLDWDEELPADLKSRWMALRGSFDVLSDFSFPRLVCVQNACNYSLHVFCDASEVAYAAVAYIVTVASDGTTESHLLCSKTRVAPANSVSVPRLELCAALLGSQLATAIITAVSSSSFEFESLRAWTDSTIVLAWLDDIPRRWNTFVGNRVSKIQEVLPSVYWGHVPSEQNPADCASRGIDGAELTQHPLWWHGPSWLLRSSDDWPNVPSINSFDAPERKQDTATCLASTIADEIIIDISRFSSLDRLKRSFAYVLRFVRCLRAKSKETGPLTAVELDASLQRIVKSVQCNEFASEIRLLSAGKSLPHNSNIRLLAPFVDTETGLLRVGGRLSKSSVDVRSKHPVLLPRTHLLSKLVALDAHHGCLHGGHALTFAHVNARFWIIRGRDVVRRVIHSCVPCARHSANFKAPFMADLPAERVNPSRAFTYTGLDYAGPFTIKSSSGRGCKLSKSYLALFVCFSTKAIHLELVSDMSTQACLAALRRFVARRGLPHTIFSDNGTNFVGCRNELASLVKLIRTREHQDSLTSFCATNSVVWKFNPPAAPHFGGLWEAGVKSVKRHLRRVVGTCHLTFEELSTVFCQVEACLNSRPLCVLSADPCDLQPLTPGHFLIGAPLLSLPDEDVANVKTNRLQRWRLLQKLVQDVWSRWRTEYLSTLQTRKKWLGNNDDSLSLGDVVLICDDCAPSSWPMAVVVELHRGSDGIARVATLRSSSKIVKRPIVKLRRLPTGDSLSASTQGGRDVEDAIHQVTGPNSP